MCSTQMPQLRNYMELSYGALKGLEHALGDADVHSSSRSIAVCDRSVRWPQGLCSPNGYSICAINLDVSKMPSLRQGTTPHSG